MRAACDAYLMEHRRTRPVGLPRAPVGPPGAADVVGSEEGDRPAAPAPPPAEGPRDALPPPIDVSDAEGSTPETASTSYHITVTP